MNPKTLIAPVLTGAIIAVAMAFYIRTIKKASTEKDGTIEGLTTQVTKAKKDVKDAADKLAKLDTEAKASSEEITALTAAKIKAEADLKSATQKVSDLNQQLTDVKTGSAKTAKDLSTKENQLADTQKKLGDAETARTQAEQKLKSIQGELAEAKRAAETAKDPGYLTLEYKSNADLVRKQVERLLKDQPDLATAVGAAAPTAQPAAEGVDPIRQDMVERMVTLNLEGQFAYSNNNGDAVTDALTWSVGAIVIGMDANNVYLISTPPPHLLDQPAARNSLTKSCTLYFSVHPAGWSGVKDPLAATFLGVLRGPNSANVGVFAVAVNAWPQAREKPVALIPAPTIQECRQWSVNGDVGYIYSRGVPAGPGSGPVRMDAIMKVGDQDIGLVLPAQAVGYELGLFGTRRAPADKSILGVYYPDGNRILWLSDLYNGVKAMASEMAKRAEVGASYVSADWVVAVGERPNQRSVDTVITEFVSFIEKR